MDTVAEFYDDPRPWPCTKGPGVRAHYLFIFELHARPCKLCKPCATHECWCKPCGTVRDWMAGEVPAVVAPARETRGQMGLFGL
jgi:hypothetical protein